MTKQFWQVDESPKQILQELQEAKPEASLWDIFTDYTPDYDSSEPADKSEEWLKQQAQLIEQIISEQLSDKIFGRYDLDLFIDSIDDVVLPDNKIETDAEAEEEKYKDLAKLIAEKYILPHKLNENTFTNFLDTLENKLVELNKELIEKEDREQTEQFIREIYSKEDADEILKNLDLSSENISEEEEDDSEDEMENVNSDDFIYPQAGLASSDTFFGFDDAGDLSYEEREKFAQEKFAEYKAEISDLLNQQPDGNLLPQGLDTEKVEREDFDWGIYYEYLDANPFANEFDGDFTVWTGDDKVLFLSISQEDKELPYEITLGGLSIDKYSEILASYNAMVKSLG